MLELLCWELWSIFFSETALYPTAAPKHSAWFAGVRSVCLVGCCPLPSPVLTQHRRPLEILTNPVQMGQFARQLNENTSLDLQKSSIIFSSCSLFFSSSPPLLLFSSPPAPPLPPPTSGASGRDTRVTSLWPRRVKQSRSDRLGCSEVPERRQEVGVGLVAGPFTPPTRLVCTRCRLGRRRRSLLPRSTAPGGGRAVPVRWRRERSADPHDCFREKPHNSENKQPAAFEVCCGFFHPFRVFSSTFCLTLHRNATFALCCCHNSKTVFFSHLFEKVASRTFYVSLFWNAAGLTLFVDVIDYVISPLR